MRRFWTAQPRNLPPGAHAAHIAAVALTAGSTAYADLPSWAVGVVAGLAYVIFGAVLEAWNRRQRSDAGPPTT
jgi:hypothetical protein